MDHLQRAFLEVLCDFWLNDTTIRVDTRAVLLQFFNDSVEPSVAFVFYKIVDNQLVLCDEKFVTLVANTLYKRAYHLKKLEIRMNNRNRENNVTVVSRTPFIVEITCNT